MDASRRILQLSGALPSDTGDGSSATFATLVAICRQGHYVTYVYPASGQEVWDNEFIEGLKERCCGRLTVFPIQKRHRSHDVFVRMFYYLWLGLVLLTRVPFRLLMEFRNKNAVINRLICTRQSMPRNLVRPVNDLLKVERFDVIQVDYPWMVRFHEGLDASIPRLFVVHEIQGEIVRYLRPSETSLYKEVIVAESHALKKYEAVIALCQEDAEILRQQYQIETVYVSPLASSRVPAESLPELSLENMTFTFLGGYVHHPNADAVEWLSDDIWPELKKTFPYSDLKVIGRFPQDFIEKHQKESFEFLGFVDDFSVHLRGTIFLCPLRIGSGMRIKIIDAIQSGAIVISTTLGARGLGLVGDQEVLIANSPEEFCRQVSRLKSGEVNAAQIIRAAQARIAASFSPHSVAERRTEIINEVIQRSKSRSHS
ncbi:glycosyltransferase [Lacunimicrobium album]